jgi:hypothetical protein
MHLIEGETLNILKLKEKRERREREMPKIERG